MRRRAVETIEGRRAAAPRDGAGGALQHWRHGLVGAVQDWAAGSLSNVVTLLVGKKDKFRNPRTAGGFIINSTELRAVNFSMVARSTPRRPPRARQADALGW